MIKLIKNRKSIFISWLLSYILILAIPFMMNIFVYTQSISTIRYAVNKSHIKSLEQFTQIIDTKFKEIRRLSTEISFNENINKVLGYKNILETSNIRSFVDIKKHIKTYKVANSFIDDIYVFYRDKDFVLGQNGKCTSYEFYSFYCKDYGIKYEDWLQMLSTKNKSNKKFIFNSYNEQLLNNIIILNPLPVAYTDNPEGNIVITISKEKLKNDLREIQLISKGLIMIVDSNNNIVTSTKELDKNIENQIKNSNELKGNESTYFKTTSGEKLIITSTVSKITDWKVVSVISEDILLEKIKYIERIIIISILLCFTVGGLIAFCLCKFNYKPIKRIVSLLRNMVVVKKDKKHSELYYIEESLLKFIDEKNKMKKQLDKHKNLLREKVLKNILLGTYKDMNISKQMCNKSGLTFIHDYFMVLIIKINNNSGFFNECKFDGIDNSNNLSKFIIKNIIEEQLREISLCYIIEIDSTLVFLINMRQQIDSKFIIEEYLIKSKTIIQQKFKINFSVSISKIHNKFQEISNSYEEAVEVFQYNIIKGDNQILLYEDLILPEIKFKGATLDDYKLLINTLKTGNYLRAENILDDIIEKDFSRLVPIQIMRCQMFGLINIVYTALEEMCDSCKKELFEELNPIDKILDCDTVYKIKNNMHVILKQIDNYLKVNNKKSNDVISKIKYYVNNNYNDRELNVSMLADKYNINPSYLSRIFKKEYGIGLLDYIHKTRIQHAKKIMDDTTLNINDISNKVGYYNSITFIRAFKRYEGMTPTQYRKYD